MLELEANEGFSSKFRQSEGRFIVESKGFTKIDELLIDDIDLVGNITGFISSFQCDVFVIGDKFINQSLTKSIHIFNFSQIVAKSNTGHDVVILE